MSELRKGWVLLRHPHGTVRFGKRCYLGPGFSLHMPGNGTFICGDDVEFRRNFRAEITGRGRIIIGDGCYFTYDVILACSTLIQIGDRVGLANESAVYDADHRFRDTSVPFLEQGFDFHEIHIADDAQIHQLCTILADIGERAVIGSNAVVSRPIPPYVLAVGAPARPVDYFGPPGGEPPELADRSESSASTSG
jgi:acetyltransferase-like isoleucine patch superfamily enzyme